VRNNGYRKYLRGGGKRFAVDEDKIKEEARYHGKWVLTTHTNLAPSEVALKYKQLWMVEEVFRTMKSLPDTRPVSYNWDQTIHGHVFCSFLALLSRKELGDLLARKKWKLEWADLIRDLDNLIEMEVVIDGKGYVFRGQTPGESGKVFQACGFALPPVLRSC
jgi:transposase